jgi:hypothetical protein
MNASINSAGEEVAAETKGIKKSHKVLPRIKRSQVIGRQVDVNARALYAIRSCSKRRRIKG